MSHNNISLQAGYILHTRPYSESSVLAEVLLADHGRVSMIAKGAKRPSSKHKGILQPFIPLTLSCVGRNELKTLTHVEVAAPPLGLQGDYLLAGFYVNELLMRLLLRDSPCSHIFCAYQEVLAALLAQQDLWVCLRIFEKNLLSALGYELNLTHDVSTGEALLPDAHYLYLLENGPVRIDANCVVQKGALIFSGKSLLDLARNNLQSASSRQQAKRLLQQALQIHLGSRPLCSSSLLLRKVNQ